METNRRMGRSTRWLVGFVCTAMTPITLGAEETKISPPSSNPTIQGPGVSALDFVGPDDIVDVPETYTVTTHLQGENGAVSSVAALPEKQIYGNTLGQKMLRFTIPNRRYADDIITDSVNGCNLTRYVVRVNGGVPNGTGEFSCKTALFTDCPPPRGIGTLIPGTEGDFPGMADDLTEMQDLIVDVSGSPIPIPPTVWVRVECDTAAASWVGGSPSEMGFTQDRFSHPSTGCDSFLGPEFYAGFYLQVYADDPPAMPCLTHYVAYAATSPTLPSINCGAGQACADDFTSILAPTGETCILSAYEVGMRGNSGPFTMTLDLRTRFTDFPVEGTEFTFIGKGDTRLEIARYVVDPAMDIIIPATPANGLWVKWEADKNGTGLINARFPAAGFSVDEFFSRFVGPPPTWVAQFANPRAAAYLVVYCRGETPRGACCKNQPTGVQPQPLCSDSQPITSCKQPNRWLKDKTCVENLFQPPCGEHACCTPSGCQDSTFTECAAFLDPTSLGLPCTNNSHCPGRVCQPDGFCSPRSGVWQNNGGFCDPGLPPGIEFQCAFYQCYFATGDCFDAEDEICCGTFCPGNTCPLGTKCNLATSLCTSRAGCSNVKCCDEVCGVDFFCCTTAWDATCVNRAVSNCELAPGNDVCANDSSLAIGAQEISIVPNGIGRWSGFEEPNNSFAVANPGDPLACCNKAGQDAPVAGTLWYKFVMPMVQSPNVQPTTARLSTCNTPGSLTAVDAVLAVYAVGDLTSEATACSTLSIVACNDDRDNCGSSGQQADICVENLQGGVTYYVMFGSSNAAFQGPYQLDLEIPCPRVLPTNNTCQGTQSLPPGTPVTATFNLLNATLDCPVEDCVNALKNDLWYDYNSPCLGSATFETCGATVNAPDPPTAIVVYRVPNLTDTCEVGSGDVVGCNDNALVNPAEHGRRSQTCEWSNLECDTSASCEFRCSVSGWPCATEANCHYCAAQGPQPGPPFQPGRPCNANTDCLTCFFNGPTGALISCTTQSAPGVPTPECPGAGNNCGFTSANQCTKPNDNLSTGFMEVCVKEPCNSSCGNAASVTVPVTPGTLYKVRMGGDFGAEVPGVMKVTCVPQDCNGNGQPDLKEIQMGTAADCNENEQIDSCEIAAQPSRDCNNNGKLDVCEIDRDGSSTGGPFFCIVNCQPDCNLNGKPDSCDMASCPTNNPACKDCNGNTKPDSCDIADGTSLDVDGNHIPDECAVSPCNVITASVVADCDIDARQPHDLKNATPAQGIMTLQLTMNATCTASTLLPGSFTVSVQPGPGAAPVISNVSGAGNVATITFATPIPPGNWTCVSLNAAPAQQVCVGFLPTDVDGNRSSVALADTNALIAALNNTTPRPLLQTDANRSTILTAEDLIAHVNLLNGADAFIPWATQSLPPCP